MYFQLFVVNKPPYISNAIVCSLILTKVTFDKINLNYKMETSENGKYIYEMVFKISDIRSHKGLRYHACY